MPKTMMISILAADSNFYEGECESLVVPTTDGQFGILPGHCEIIAAITPGMLSYTLPGSERKYAAVSGGLLKIEGNSVLILVDSAERPEDIDANRAQRAADAAREEMLRKKSSQEYHSAQAHLARAINRLRVREHVFNSRSK